jgi:hypothetical protein
LTNNKEFKLIGCSGYNTKYFTCVLSKDKIRTIGHLRKIAFCKIFPNNPQEMILEINYLDPSRNIFNENMFFESDKKIELWIKKYFQTMMKK